MLSYVFDLFYTAPAHCSCCIYCVGVITKFQLDFCLFPTQTGKGEVAIENIIRLILVEHQYRLALHLALK